MCKHNSKLAVILSLIISLVLLTTTTIPAFAYDEYPPDQTPQSGNSGSVSKSVYTDPPGSKASNAVPGGGYAVATASMNWAVLRMTGKSTTSLSSTVFGSDFDIYARVASLYRESDFACSSSGAWKYNQGANDSVSKSCTKFWYTLDYTWKLTTYHEVNTTGYRWTPTIVLYAYP